MRRRSRANFIPGDIFPSHNQRHELRTGGAPYRETDGRALKAAPVYTPDAVQEVV
jgi:hypothetical protein